MNKNKAQDMVEKILAPLNIEINGSRPWDIKVKNDRVFSRILSEGSLGLGEAYMDGWWEAQALDETVTKILRANIDKIVRGNWKSILWAIGQVAFNRQRKSLTHNIGEKHYDIGNDLYNIMLDKRKVYTCGYWKNATNLDEAQEAKLDLVCRKIGLKPGQKVLDIGCGWGSFAKFAAERYGAHVTGVTVSKEQIAWGKELCEGLPVELYYQDYRDVKGQFDHIVSLGMFEHVGYKNYKTYMKVVREHLKDDGLFLLHTIGHDYSIKTTDPWIGKYIFPDSMIPSAKQITTATEKLFIIEDWHCFGTDYDKTLIEWRKNFEAGWPKIKDKYSERFYRMWRYYLFVSAASFRSRKNNLWQIVLSKNGIPGGYESIR